MLLSPAHFRRNCRNGRWRRIVGERRCMLSLMMMVATAEKDCAFYVAKKSYFDQRFAVVTGVHTFGDLLSPLRNTATSIDHHPQRRLKLSICRDHRCRTSTSGPHISFLLALGTRERHRAFFQRGLSPEGWATIISQLHPSLSATIIQRVIIERRHGRWWPRVRRRRHHSDRSF